MDTASLCPKIVVLGIAEYTSQVVKNIQIAEYSFHRVDLPNDWQTTGQLNLHMWPENISAILYVIDESDFKLRPLTSLEFRHVVYSASGILVITKPNETIETLIEDRCKANDALNSIHSKGIGIYAVSEGCLLNKDSFATKIRNLHYRCFSVTQLFQATIHLKHTILLFGKDDDTTPLKSYMESASSDHFKYICLNLPLQEECPPSTKYEQTIQNEIKEPFNVILLVVNKADLGTNKLPLHNWTFRAKTVSSALGIVITGCSENEDKDELIKSIHPGLGQTIEDFAKLGVHAVSQCIDSDLLEKISKHGLEIHPSGLYDGQNATGCCLI